MTNQNNFKPGQNHGAKTGRNANERSGETNKGSQNNSDHRATERDGGNQADRNAKHIREGNQKAQAATAKNSAGGNQNRNRDFQNRKVETETQASGKSGI